MRFFPQIFRSPPAWAGLILCVSLAPATWESVHAQDEVPAQGNDVTAAAVQQPVPNEKVVFVIPVHEEIERGLYLILTRALREAESQGAEAVVLDMHTPGGTISAALKIRDLLVRSPVKTYTYVNNMAISAGSLIALATDRIVMAPGSNIGGALPIQVGLGGASPVDEKMLSIFASEMRKTAKQQGYPPSVVKIAEAFSNPDVVIPGLKEKGKILTLDYDQATSLGLSAYISPSLEDMLEREGLGDARVVHFEFTRTDAVARFLSSSAVMGILMLAGMGGIFFEVRTPGFGVPGAIGATALALYFFGSYLANLSGYMEIIFFILGLSLLIAEVFVTPGFGLFGISGVLLMVGSLFFALFNLAPRGYGFSLTRLEAPLLTMLITMIAGVAVLWMIARLLPHTPLYGALRLAPTPSLGAGIALGDGTSEPLPGAKVGDQGIAVTDLRPSGTAEFNGRRADVLTRGEFIEQGQEITIEAIESHLVFVRTGAPKR